MKKIYIVDDDRDMVDAITIILQAEGYETQSQFDSKDILDNIAQMKPDVIILDVMFPENDGAGFDMAREIRHDERVRNIPILMLSAINEKGIYAGTFSNKDIDDMYLPVNEFIEKPVEPKELIRKVERLLS